MKPHFLQSPTWSAYEKLEGNTVLSIDTPTASGAAIIKSTPVGAYYYFPYGPTFKSSNPSTEEIKSFLKAATTFAKSHDNPIFLRLEPTFPLESPKSLGLVKSHDLNPAHTWTLDLTQPEADLLKSMRKSNVQYWRSHAKKGVKIRQTKDPEEISHLTSLLQAVGAKDHFNPQDETHLKNQLKSGFATLYLAELDGQVLAASLVYDFDDTRFYAHAATSDAERKIAAGTVLLVQMILDAKARGAKTFDFWGITTSDDPKHPWYGFTKYKQSFGGEQVDYAGTWDYPIRPFRYKLYQFLRQLNRLKRKLHH